MKELMEFIDSRKPPEAKVHDYANDVFQVSRQAYYQFLNGERNIGLNPIQAAIKYFRNRQDKEAIDKIHSFVDIVDGTFTETPPNPRAAANETTGRIR